MLSFKHSFKAEVLMEQSKNTASKAGLAYFDKTGSTVQTKIPAVLIIVYLHTT